MRLKAASLALLLLIAAAPTFAAPPSGTAPVTVQTMFKPVPRSMQQLISDGYQIVNIAIGLSGFGYLLKQDTHYITCAVQPDRTKPDVFVSECRAMN